MAAKVVRELLISQRAGAVLGDVVVAAVGRGGPSVAEAVVVGGRRGRGGVGRLRRPLHAVEVAPAQRVRGVARLGAPALRGGVDPVRRRPTAVLQTRVVLLLEPRRRRHRRGLLHPSRAAAATCGV